MKKNQVILLTAYNGFFGQSRRPHVSLKSDRLIEWLRHGGFTANRYDLHEIANRPEPLRDAIIFYTFSQRQNVRDYLIDLVHSLDDGSNLLIPSFPMLMCHEDKFYQELYKRKIGLSSLRAWCFSSRQELAHYDFPFPVVVKRTEGSDSKAVFLARNRKELERITRGFEKITLRRRLDLFRRRYLRPEKHYAWDPDYSNFRDYVNYRDHIRKERNFIVQEFVPGLSYDWRVLVLYDHYYLVMRHNRANDFRASGSKKFDFDFAFDPRVLEYARSVFEKFDTPFLSMDIGVSGDKYFLFEFQALHFGMDWVLNTSGYYVRKNGEWQFENVAADLERDLIAGLIRYIQKKIGRTGRE